MPDKAVFERILTIMGIVKAKDAEKGSDTFPGVFFYVCKKSNRTFAIAFRYSYTSYLCNASY